MALINCKYCGKQISDKARTCPSCGKSLIEKPTSSFFCQECGKLIPIGNDVCPNCGCPVEEINNDLNPQSYEAADVSQMSAPDSSKRRVTAIAVIIAIIVGLIIACVVFGSARTKLATVKYKSDLTEISGMILDSAKEIESAGNTTLAVWHNAIFEKSDPETDKFTCPDGRFVDDFNTALDNLYKDDSYSQIIQDIQNDQAEILAKMKEMNKPPKGCEEEYKALKDCYDSYMTFANIVISPNGSYNSVSEEFHNADEALLKHYTSLITYTN